MACKKGDCRWAKQRIPANRELTPCPSCAWPEYKAWKEGTIAAYVGRLGYYPGQLADAWRRAQRRRGSE